MSVARRRLERIAQPAESDLRPWANASLVLCLSAPGLLYVEWLLAWAMLGHMPRPSLDDPKSIDGSSWMHMATLIGMIVSLPMTFTALLVNCWYGSAARRAPLEMLVRIAVALSSLVLLFGAPFRIGEWWID